MAKHKKPLPPGHVLTLYGQTRDEVLNAHNLVVRKLGYTLENPNDWPFENIYGELSSPNPLKEPMSGITMRFNNKGEDVVDYAAAEILSNQIGKLLEENGFKTLTRRDPLRADKKHFARQLILV